MSDTDSEDLAEDHARLPEKQAPEEILPAWYREIYPAGGCDGFYEKIGDHALIHVDRGPETLVVTFDNLSDAGYKGYDIRAWAENFLRDSNVSHLGVVAQGPTWFRDAALIARMEALAARGFFRRFERVVMAGTSMGGFGALAFADLAPGCDVLAFSPQTTLAAGLVPWETRFAPGRAQDWTLPRSDAARTLAGVNRIWLVYDPFLAPDRHQALRLPQDRVIALKAFGQGHKTALVLRRMEQLKAVMGAAIDGTLTPALFYRLTRGRKDLYLYRKVMEGHLSDRGHAARIPAFQRAFRLRAQRTRPAGSVPETSAPEAQKEIVMPDASRPLQNGPARKPRTLGNVWQLIDDGQSLRYLSDQYRGQVMGFEERHGVTLAQTPDVALGMACVGGSAGVPRPLPERFDYYIRDEALSQDSAPYGATAQGVASLSSARARHHALRNVIALSQPQAGITAAESLPEAAIYQRLFQRIAQAKEALAPWGKSLFIDRISLDLLAGAPEMLELEAQSHYSEVIQWLRPQVARAAGHSSLPHVSLCQKAGSRTDGTSEVILAEGRLEIYEPALGIILASPSYMLRLMPETVATILPEDRLWLDEMEACAIETVQNGGKWHCPSLRQVLVDGARIFAEFATLGPLEFDETQPHHGFTLSGCDNGAQITAIGLGPHRAGGQFVVLDCDRAPTGPALHLDYAFGQSLPPAGDDRPANRGALREVWSRPSLLQEGRHLHRYALSSRLPVMPSDLQVAP
ncbi:hypothetical protein [Thioclava sp. GXIMD4216]|uniref:hypothetical protein n=1 Tax=Thioclava sp. GXIMD4216 TaxID=3131929 RepID=UPI0030CD7E39